MAVDIVPQISPIPAPGSFYSIVYGDALLTVAGTAFSIGPGGERLDRARLINGSEYNSRFLGAPTKLFPEGQLSFMPKFASDPNEQADAEGACPKGHSFATIWIPLDDGDEPDLDEPVPDEPDPVTPDPIEPDRPIPQPFVDWEELVRHSFTFTTGKHHKLVLRREIIPIILVPGIAGSALEPSEPIRSRRFPGWPVNQIKKMLRLAVKGPRLKRKNLIGDGFHDPGFLRVIGGNKPDAPDGGLAGVAKIVYENFVLAMREADYGDRNRMFFRLPVHCFGYNWTADMRESASALARYVDQIIRKYQRFNRRCRHVILVAHSAGGLVFRHACLDSSFSACVQGVVHVGVPHAGTPEVYHRMKKGFPRGTLLDLIFSAVTARDGDEATVLFANMPGAVQLLPSKSYRTNVREAAWLVLDTTEGSVIGLPASDPYAEIYRSLNNSWGLVDPELLLPHVRRTEENRRKAWESYLGNIGAAEDFHERLQSSDHPAAHYLSGHSMVTAEQAEFKFIGDKWMIAAFRASPLTGFGRRQNKGEYTAIGTLNEDDDREWLVQMREPAGNGDLTVPWATATGDVIGVSDANRIFEFAGIEHASMLEHAEVQQAIHSIVLRLLESKVSAIASGPESSVPLPA